MTDECFRGIYNFMKSITDVSAEIRISIMNTHPNKIAYKRIKKYDLLTIDTSNIFVYKQAADAALAHVKKLWSIASSSELYGKSMEFMLATTIPNKRLFTRGYV
jgi:hypothetical protein